MSRKKICFFSLLIFVVTCFFAGCTTKSMEITVEKKTPDWKGFQYSHSMELVYAKNFSVDYYENGYALISIMKDKRFLLVPENKPIPKNLETDILVLQKPIENIYLVATSAMDLFCSLDGLTAIRFSGLRADSWHIEKAREAMEQGNIQYAGKYSAPDYERIVSQGCGLAIESTMIHHTPEVKEKLEEFGIPVMVEYSSYEPHPLGRMEWIKLYAVLLGKEELAERLIQEQEKKINSINIDENSKKTVAFFYISSTGYANVRKPGDYVSKMIDLAGGQYVFETTGNQENALSTINMQMESFYAEAKDVDILIYNSTIDGELKTMEDLLKKAPLLKDFKAVQTGNVWCTTKSVFQETMSIGNLILDFHTVIYPDNSSQPPVYLYRLQ